MRSQAHPDWLEPPDDREWHQGEEIRAWLEEYGRHLDGAQQEATMADISQFLGNDDFLSGTDLPEGASYNMKIHAVTQETVGQQNPEAKWVVAFEKSKKRLTLNKGNRNQQLDRQGHHAIPG
jgi:hypothetical protein